MINRIILPQTRPWAGSPVWIGDFQQDGREQIQVFIGVKGCGLKLVWLCWCTVYTWCVLHRAAVNRCLRTSWWIPFSLLGHEGSLAPVFLSTVQIILLNLSLWVKPDNQMCWELTEWSRTYVSCFLWNILRDEFGWQSPASISDQSLFIKQISYIKCSTKCFPCYNALIMQQKLLESAAYGQRQRTPLNKSPAGSYEHLGVHYLDQAVLNYTRRPPFFSAPEL